MTKVTLVTYVYDVNGMMAACRLMYTVVLDMVLPVFPVHREDRQHHNHGWKKQPKHVGELCYDFLKCF